MSIMDEIMFLNTYTDFHVNGTNRSYWAKFFKEISEYLHDKNLAHLHSSFNENMPIYEYFSQVKQRFVRIMQYNPQNELIKKGRYKTYRFYTAWIDERFLNDEILPVPELVICLLMTKRNIDNAENLIRTWLLGSDERTYDLINKIYEEQERLDKQDE